MAQFKQIDNNILHLCGQNALIPTSKDLGLEKYQGGVRMGDTGIVLNTCRISAVVPLHWLRLIKGGWKAEWQGHSWTVFQVPQRCWSYDGCLVTQKNPMADSPAPISTEDVSRIGQHINRYGARPGEVVFRPDNAMKEPLQDIRAAIKEVRERRKRSERGRQGGWPLGAAGRVVGRLIVGSDQLSLENKGPVSHFYCHLLLIMGVVTPIPTSGSPALIRAPKDVSRIHCRSNELVRLLRIEVKAQHGDIP
ncbi:hypothetical protein RSO68_15810 [Halomonas saccharevitans]|uniref:Uncharacterized protein n=1 Tax=Halomonas saccharevitans TaxID=416872 RepID=A0ABU3NID5_9GAMM|nr:hypothetical protein [Halomonas saccharevitans]MDT8880933.1 hypothetical protein [Halomonas saccharevitans]